MTLMILILILIAVLAGCAAFMVRGYELSRDVLLIRRVGWKTRIPLEQLISAEADPEAMNRSWRVWGNGGLFAICGLFRNKKLGSYRAYATNPAHAVVLRFSKGTIVVTPTNPAAFATAIQSSCRPGAVPVPKPDSKGWRAAVRILLFIGLAFPFVDAGDKLKNWFAYRTFYPKWTALSPPGGNVVLAVKFSGLPFDKWDILIGDIKDAIRQMDTRAVVRTSLTGNAFWNVSTAQFQYAPSSMPVDASVQSQLYRAVRAFGKRQNIRGGNFSYKVLFGNHTRERHIDGWDAPPAAGEIALAVRHEGMTQAELRTLEDIFSAIEEEIPSDKFMSIGVEWADGARSIRGYIRMRFRHSLSKDDPISHRFYAAVENLESEKGILGVKEAKVIEGAPAMDEKDVDAEVNAEMDAPPPAGRVVLFVGYNQIHIRQHYDLGQLISGTANVHSAGHARFARIQVRLPAQSSGMVEGGTFRVEFAPYKLHPDPAVMEADLEHISQFEQKHNLSGHIESKMIYPRVP